MKFLHPEILRSLTPIIIALIGGSVAVCIIVLPNTAETKNAGFGFASTAIAGAAGLAQSAKDKNT